jgi:hypothetical protein
VVVGENVVLSGSAELTCAAAVAVRLASGRKSWSEIKELTAHTISVVKLSVGGQDIKFYEYKIRELCYSFHPAGFPQYDKAKYLSTTWPFKPTFGE